MGAALQSPRGWVWVTHLSSQWRRVRDEPVLTPRPTPTRCRSTSTATRASWCPSIEGSAGRLRVTANFFVTANVRRAKARLLDGDGREVDCYLSTPEKRLPGTGNYRHLVVIPKKALAPKTTYRVEAEAEADGKAWFAGVAVRDDGRRTPR